MHSSYFWQRPSQGVSLFFIVGESTEEREFQAYRQPEPGDQPDPLRLITLEQEAAAAKNARRVSSLKAAFTAASLAFLLRLLWRVRPAREAGSSPDLGRLLAEQAHRQSSARQHITHFYESRRDRCRAARARLKDKMDSLFGAAESHAHDLQEPPAPHAVPDKR